MFKKSVAILLTILMVASIFAGCGSSDKKGSEKTDTSAASESTAEKEQSKDQPKEPMEIVMWHTGPEDTAADSHHSRYVAFGEKYKKDNPHVSVKVTGNQTLDKILTALSSGQGPDIYLTQWPTVASWSEKGAMMDLTEYVNNDKEFDKGDILEGAWGTGVFKGKIFAIPFEMFSSELFYNKDLLAKDGYTKPPETFEELVEMAIKLTKYDAKGNVTQAGYIPDFPWLDNVLWPVAFGAQWIDPAANKITFDSPEMAAAYQWQVDIYDKVGRDKLMKYKSGLGKLEGAQDPFLSGKLAMMFSGEWVFSNVAKYNPSLNYGVAPIPYPKDHPELKGSMFITDSVWCLNGNTKLNKDELWKYMSVFTSKEQYKEFAKGQSGAGQLMSRKSALTQIPDTADPMLKQVATMFDGPKCRAFPMLAYVNEYLAAINDEMTLALNGKKSVAEAQKKVVEKVQPMADKNPLN